MVTIRLRSGLPPRPFPSAEEAAAHEWTDGERAMADQVLAAQAVGSPETVERRLADLIEMTGADELMATVPVTDQAARHEAVQLLARMALAPAASR